MQAKRHTQSSVTDGAVAAGAARTMNHAVYCRAPRCQLAGGRSRAALFLACLNNNGVAARLGPRSGERAGSGDQCHREGRRRRRRRRRTRGGGGREAALTGGLRWRGERELL